MRLYLDSSALVKLVQEEQESATLREFLAERRADQRTTSRLARVEVIRAVLPAGHEAIAHARRELSRVDQIPLTDALLDRAAEMDVHPLLRTLDAIHLASAQLIGADLRAVVTYDERMQEAAELLSLPVEAPT